MRNRNPIKLLITLVLKSCLHVHQHSWCCMHIKGHKHCPLSYPLCFLLSTFFPISFELTSYCIITDFFSVVILWFFRISWAKWLIIRAFSATKLVLWEKKGARPWITDPSAPHGVSPEQCAEGISHCSTLSVLPTVVSTPCLYLEHTMCPYSL